MRQVAIEKVCPYACEDADISWQLKQLFAKKIQHTALDILFKQVELPLIPVLASMELEGIKVDRDILSRMSNTFAQKMANLEFEVHEAAGEVFNIGSPKQLGEILFDKMSIPGAKKGKT